MGQGEGLGRAGDGRTQLILEGIERAKSKLKPDSEQA